MNRIKIAIGVSVAILVGLLIAVLVLWYRPTAEDLKNSQAETAFQKQRADGLDAKLKTCEAKQPVVSTGPATQPQGSVAGNESDAYHFLLGDKLGGIAKELGEVRKHQQDRQIARSVEQAQGIHQTKKTSWVRSTTQSQTVATNWSGVPCTVTSLGAPLQTFVEENFKGATCVGVQQRFATAFNAQCKGKGNREIEIACGRNLKGF